jgi:hypothetical protein
MASLLGVLCCAMHNAREVSCGLLFRSYVRLLWLCSFDQLVMVPVQALSHHL